MPEQTNTPTAVNVGNKKGSKKWLWISLVVVLLIALIGGGVSYCYVKVTKKVIVESPSDIVATVDGKNITRAELDAFTYGVVMQGTPQNPDLKDTGVEKRTVLDEMVENEIMKAEVKNVGISYTTADVNKFILASFPGIDTASTLYRDIYDYQEYLYLKDAFTKKLMGEREGKYIIARNDTYYPDPKNEITTEDQKKIDSSIVYAKNFINDLSTKLTAKTITFDNAIKTELDDKVIGEAAPSPNATLHSGSFNSNDYVNKIGIMSHKQAFEKLASLKVGEVSAPFKVTATYKDKEYDAGWVIITPTKVVGETSQSFETWYQNVTKKHNISQEEV